MRIRMIFLVMTGFLSGVKTLGASEGPSTQVPVAKQVKRAPKNFRHLHTESSILIDCSFDDPRATGRIRISSIGEVHFLVSSLKGRNIASECRSSIKYVSRNEVSVRNPLSLHLSDPAKCTPEIPNDSKKLLSYRLELLIEGSQLLFFLLDQDKPLACEKLVFKPADLNSTLKRLKLDQ